MAPRKRAPSRLEPGTEHVAIPSEVAKIKPSTEVGTYTLPETRKSKLPSTIRFPLAILLSLSLNVLLYGLATNNIRDLTAISRLDADWNTALTLFGARIADLALAWISGFDGYDVAALALLIHTPYYFLLHTFYTISSQTIALCTAIDILSTTLPFILLRGASAPHQSNAPKGSVANRSIIDNLPIQVVTSILGSGVYASVVLSAYFTFLRTWLIVHFNNLPSLTAAYETQFFLLVLSFLPVGIALKVFLFTPSTAAKRDAIDAQNAAFDAESASLVETLWYNVWGYSKRTRTLMSRTAVLALVSAGTTAVRTYASIDGVELGGALGWAATWAVAAVCAGGAYGWVVGTEVLQN